MIRFVPAKNYSTLIKGAEIRPDLPDWSKVLSVLVCLMHTDYFDTVFSENFTLQLIGNVKIFLIIYCNLVNFCAAGTWTGKV